MVNEFIYIIENFGGQWSDSWQCINGVFLDKDKAIEEAEKYWEKHGNYISKLPVPYNVYHSNVYNFDALDYNDDGVLVDKDGNQYTDDNDYYLFKDAYGYTKEQWEETHKIIEELDDNSYCFTSINKYSLNTIPPTKEKIWEKFKIEPYKSDDDDYRDSDYTGEGCVHTQINSFD